MNTMYRNKWEEYDDVKDKFHRFAPSILTKENVSTESAFKRVIEKLSDSNDVRIKAKLDEEVSGLEGKWPDDKGKIKDTVWGLMPKALLHVHSTVGLSVDDLGELIINWNKSEGEGKRPDGAPEIVYDQVPGKDMKVLMYNTEVEVEGKIYKPCEENGTDAIPITEKGQWDTIKGDFYLQTVEENNWENFKIIFAKVDALFWNRDFYYRYHKKFFERCRENGIKYIELRTGFQEFVDKGSSPDKVAKSICLLQPGFDMEHFFYHRERMTEVKPEKPNIEFLKMIYKAATESRYEKDDVKVILTANRNKKKDVLESEFYEGICKKADAAIVIKNMNNAELPEIAGFDLVNQECKENGKTDEFAKKILYSRFGKYDKTSLSYYNDSSLNKLTKFDGFSRNRINLIRYFFHDGESIEQIKSPDDNAITGPICSRYRIGHGFKMGTEENFDVTKLPVDEVSSDQRRKAGNGITDYILYGESDDVTRRFYPVKESGEKYIRKDTVPEPVLELCPISNYMLGYVEDFKSHPVITLMNNGIFTVICNDDPQIFDNPGLSYDYAVMYKSIYDERDEYKAYNWIKLSSFLGFFYKEMSRYYYQIQLIDSEKVFFVNDSMGIGEEGDTAVEDTETNPDNITEWSIFNKAVQVFKEKWAEFAYSILES